MSKKINLEIKVVVVGAEDSGKTSLISKYVSGETPQNPSRVSEPRLIIEYKKYI